MAVLSSVDEELLEAISTHVAQALLPTLSNRISLKPSASRPALMPLSAVPVLSLNLKPAQWPDRQVCKEQLPSVLRAFAELAMHSRRLDAFPERVKVHFWGEIGSAAEPNGINMDMLVKAESPSFMVNFSNAQQPGELDSTVSAILYAFMTTPVSFSACELLDRLSGRHQAAIQEPETIRIALGLSFANCNLQMNELLHLQSLLDCVFSHPERQFDIDVLGLSDNVMGPAELAIVAKIVQKNGSVYKIKELSLNNVLARPGSSAHTDTPAAFLQIVKTVLHADKMPISSVSSSQPFVQAPPSTLTSVSWSGNYLCPEYFVVLGSALRYGSPVEYLLSSFNVPKDISLDIKKECWRWIAFALFYPRPKRFGDAHKLRGIGKLELGPDAWLTLERTLRNPVAELVYNGKVGPGVACGDKSPSEAMVCTVRSGAKIAIVQRLGSRAQIIKTCEKPADMEVLCEKVDGSVCVVVPGAGLGWVQRQDVTCIGREPMELCSAQPAGRYDLEPLWETHHARHDQRFRASLYTVVKPLWDVFTESDKSFRYVLKVIGPQLRSLDLSSSSRAFAEGNLGLILRHCSTLQHLNLDHLELSEKCANDFLTALSGELGDHLLYLNVSGYMINDEFVEAVVRVLYLSGRELALQELCFQGFHTIYGFLCLSRVLSRNHTLRALKLSPPGRSHSWPNNFKNYTQLMAKFDGQLLSSPLPIRSKLAFLSVEAQRHADIPDAGSLDRWLLTLIFEFAEPEQVRRSIHWSKQIRERHDVPLG